jgi:hypothetical protein
MFLSLLKRTVKNALHSGPEEWSLESGLPRKVVKEMRAQRLARAAQAATEADDEAARALEVEDEDNVIDGQAVPPVLTMPSAARLTGPDACPRPDLGDEALMEWVHNQREAKTTWAEIARLANEAGHSVTEDALRMRHGRWRDKTQSPASE